MSAALPAIATRGRQFAVARLTRVDARAEVVVGRPIGTLLAEAQRAAAAIDWRLQPTVILVERVAP